MKDSRLPVTDSIEELARFWDTHDATDFDDEFEEVTEPVFERRATAPRLTADVSQALRDTENALRDFIGLVLQRRFADDWVEKCGVSADRIEKWRQRKLEEEKTQRGGTVEERPIYYADFYDLPTILRRNWDGEFSEAFGDLKTFEVWLNELARLRNPEAHRRELLPHQKHLILGLAGEIRSLIVRYRSKEETSEDYFPRIESARDNFGNIWTPQRRSATVHTESRLRPGDQIEFVVTAQDPLGEELEFGVRAGRLGSLRYFWGEQNFLRVDIERVDVGLGFEVVLLVRSRREFHAWQEYDDSVSFYYEVLPPKTPSTSRERSA